MACTRNIKKTAQPLAQADPAKYALTKTVHPAQFAGQVTGGTGSWLPPTLRSAPFTLHPPGMLREVCCARDDVPLRFAAGRISQSVRFKQNSNLRKPFQIHLD
jgi:hypothetical protein